MNPVVTLGVCARNSEKTVGGAIESIIDQDYPHDLIQIIFIDDGSIDHTPQIMADYAKKMDIKATIFRTIWKGLGPARNIVFRNASGKYILWVDADEVLTKSYVRKQVQFMEKNPRIGITSGIIKLSSGNIILSLEHIPDIVNRLNYGKPRSFFWKTDKMPGTGGSTYRKVALAEVKGFDEKVTGVGEDQEVAKRIQDAGWLFQFNYAEFYELHGGLANFKDLGKKYLWYGKGGHKLYSQNRRIFSLLRMSPVGGLAAGFLYSLRGYKIFHQKQVFLLPIHYTFKMTAWMLGFMKSQFDSSVQSSKH